MVNSYSGGEQCGHPIHLFIAQQSRRKKHIVAIGNPLTMSLFSSEERRPGF
tara:strand:- start:1124 stop:1276 length:153 start_codon:yes stop_codon:yes gene_type:complete